MKQNLDVYQAGPGFMFAFLPQDVNEIEFSYRRSFIEWFSDAVSLLTISWIAYVVASNWLRKLKKKNRRRFL